ncbi:hypothetical protein [Pseudodesulfovibrio sediminis]|uniref:Uncharacterized protein n=1 Tax=Pseudodesulfovibrio sediminis TaxID=2810563 RepID=A0ABM7P224_9BACT|nr:hypothetical protein [Pseudodesulfovibrio sediminis]BCS86842.1 hypothetical protein PSDVSF_00840 [Pseudodesulfovibrio sediminis]
MKDSLLPKSTTVGKCRVTLSRVEPDETWQELDETLKEYVLFKQQVERVLKEFSSRLTTVTGPLYIKSLRAMGWSECSGTSPDWLIDGFHQAHHENLKAIENGFGGLCTAIRQARTMARLLGQRR